MNRSAYHVFIIGGTSTEASTLARTFAARLRDLGLPPAHASFQRNPALSTLAAHTAPAAGVFFGGQARDRSLDELATKLCSEGIFVLPVVDDLAGYSAQVPPCLHPINGAQKDLLDPDMHRITEVLLERLGLVRAERLVFISYSRSEASRIALQLYRAFDERAYDVFLDTHSIRAGEEFQSVLWDRMADADLLVLLDSPTALSRRWVREELTRAETLGLGVLQLVWPNHTRTPGTEFCYAVYLETSDFLDSAEVSGNTAGLTEPAVTKLTNLAEGLRARAIAAKRSRLVGEIVKAANSEGFATALHEDGRIELTSPKSGRYVAIPATGHPDSASFHICDTACQPSGAKGMVFYDGLGILPKRMEHFAWLNQFLPAQARNVREIKDWFRANR